MGRLSEARRGARFLGGFVLGMPGACRRMARAGDGDAAREELQSFARGHLERAGLEVEITGQECLPASGYVFTYNECAFPDIVVNQGYFWAFVDHGVTVPIWRYFPWFVRAADRIGLEILPSGRKAVDALMNRFADEARSGRRILWGGEGGLTGVDGVKPFKTGGARIAIRAGVPLVPAAIQGSQLLMPLGGLRLRPGRIRVAIGEPIPTEGLTEDDAKALADRARDAVAELYAGLATG